MIYRLSLQSFMVNRSKAPTARWAAKLMISELQKLIDDGTIEDSPVMQIADYGPLRRADTTRKRRQSKR